MAVYELTVDFDQATFFALVDHKAGFFDQFDGRSHRSSWTPIAVQPADVPEDDAKLADFTMLGTVPLVSRTASKALADLLRGACEFLPVRYPRKEYYLFNVTDVLDALDEAASALTRFPTGRVMRIDRYAFRADAVAGASVFRIPQLLMAYVFATDRVVTAAREANLSGFASNLVWRG